MYVCMYVRRDLLIRTAMEGVEESYRRQKQEVKLINDYHVLKGKCDDIYEYRYRHRPILVFINSYIYACF